MKPSRPTRSNVTLNTARHDRTAFWCRHQQVDNFFKEAANKLVRPTTSASSVMVDPAGQLIGFYAINAHEIKLCQLPPE